VSLADDFVAAFEPWITPDLEEYLRAIGGMFSEVELYSVAADDELGWSVLLDTDLCPPKALPHRAMYAGERLPVGISDVMAREWIKDAPNQIRGTVASIVRAAQRRLIGQRTVQIDERSGVGGTDDPDRLIVNTYTSETPDPAGVFADLRRDVVPGDIVLVHQVLGGQTWASVRTTYATWAAVRTANPTWQDLRHATPGFTTYTRPRP
jgi:hypothetical protein